MRARWLPYCVLGVLCLCAITLQIGWAQNLQPRTHEDYVRMTAELQAQKLEVLKQMQANNVALFDIQGLGDLLKAPLPFPEPVDLATKGDDLKSAEQAYKNGDNDAAMSKFYDVLSWFVLQFAKVGDKELGSVHDTAKAATQFEMEWQTKIGKHDELISQLAKIAQKQAELDRSSAAKAKPNGAAQDASKKRDDYAKCKACLDVCYWKTLIPDVACMQSCPCN